MRAVIVVVVILCVPMHLRRLCFQTIVATASVLQTVVATASVTRTAVFARQPTNQRQRFARHSLCHEATTTFVSLLCVALPWCDFAQPLSLGLPPSSQRR